MRSRHDRFAQRSRVVDRLFGRCLTALIGASLMPRRVQRLRKAAVALGVGIGLWCLSPAPLGVGGVRAQDNAAAVEARPGDVGAAAQLGDAAAIRRVRRLAQAGAPTLAVDMLAAQQPDRATRPGMWEVWERERLLIHQSWSQWRKLASRVDRYPNTLTPSFSAFALEMAAQAQLALGNGARARQLLLRLQLGAPSAAKDTHARWRRMVIRTYLMDEAVQDADRAMVRYRWEFGDLGDDWPLLRASVLLKTGRAELVEAALAATGTAAAELLRWYAQALNDPAAVRRLLPPVRRRLKLAETLPAAQRAALFALRAFLAEQLVDLPTRALYLERALGVSAPAAPASALAVGGDDLWAAYLALGQATTSEEQLLVGDDRRWYRRTEALLKQAPVRARALLALVVAQGRTRAQRHEAASRLASSLVTTTAGRQVLRRLFIDTERFARIAQIPPAVRFHLTDGVLAEGDMALATQLVADLDPDDASYDWQLRRARILVLGGREQLGAEVLQTLLARQPERVRADVARFQQVIFDLQTMERDDLAVPLFQALSAIALPPQAHRELLFWQAESQRALGQRRVAAELFLRSAGYHDPFSMDPWAQTARFYAAETLADAGLTEDARLIYDALIAVTEDQARQATLRQRIQRLPLINADGE